MLHATQHISIRLNSTDSETNDIAARYRRNDPIQYGTKSRTSSRADLLLERVGLGQRHGAPAVVVAVKQPLHALLGAVLAVEVLHPGGAAAVDVLGAGLLAVGGVEEPHGGDLGGLLVRVLLHARVEGVSGLVAGFAALGEDVGHDGSGVVVVVGVGVGGGGHHIGVWGWGILFAEVPLGQGKGSWWAGRRLGRLFRPNTGRENWACSTMTTQFLLDSKPRTWARLFFYSLLFPRCSRN